MLRYFFLLALIPIQAGAWFSGYNYIRATPSWNVVHYEHDFEAPGSSKSSYRENAKILNVQYLMNDGLVVGYSGDFRDISEVEGMSLNQPSDSDSTIWTLGLRMPTEKTNNFWGVLYNHGSIKPKSGGKTSVKQYQIFKENDRSESRSRLYGGYSDDDQGKMYAVGAEYMFFVGQSPFGLGLNVEYGYGEGSNSLDGQFVRQRYRAGVQAEYRLDLQ